MVPLKVGYIGSGVEDGGSGGAVEGVVVVFIVGCSAVRRSVKSSSYTSQPLFIYGVNGSRKRNELTVTYYFT